MYFRTHSIQQYCMCIAHRVDEALMNIVDEYTHGVSYEALICEVISL